MKQVWCIHGNLQQASVWNFLNGLDDLSINPVDLWSSTSTGFWDWAEQFCKQLEPSETHIILGYSLGGRLALHTLLHQPELFSSAVIVAADSGLTSQKERTQRLAWDQAWGKRFLEEDWQALLNDWDSQAVFAGYKNTTQRIEAAFSREAIARLFDVFSKGRQDDLLPYLSKLKSPKITYVSGEDDKRYTEVGRFLESNCPALTQRIIPNAAHRVPWENQNAFIHLLKEILA